MELQEIERKEFFRESLFKAPSVEKLIQIAREQKIELRDARLAVVQLTKLIEYLEEEILEKDEIIQDLTKGRN